MKPLEILSALPKWGKTTPDQILESPAFAMPCRLGEENLPLRPGSILTDDTLALSILFGEEPHTLKLSRSPRFAELDKLWDSRADMPAPILLALVEKECGPLLQLLENAVRSQLRLVGLADASAAPDERTLFLQVADIAFALTRTDTVAAALGNLRHLDLGNEELRAESLPAEVEYAAFVLPSEDLASLAVGDSLLLPEIGSVAPRLIADGLFAVDETGVAPFADDGRCRVVATEASAVTLGELFDAAESGLPKVDGSSGEAGLQLRLVKSGKILASGRLDRLGEHPAFIVEALG